MSDGIAPGPDATVSEAIYTKRPNLFYMLLLGSATTRVVVMMTVMITDRKKAGRGGHEWVCARTRSQHTPTCAHTNRIYTDMYSYLQVSSPNSKRRRFENSVSPIFPFLKFVFFVQRRSSSALCSFFFSSARCHSLILSLRLSITANPPRLRCSCTTRFNTTGFSWICVKCYNRLLREN